MSDVSAALVKKLRDQTGAGMMDCKTALIESRGNLEDAQDWLRKKGISGAEKKSIRTAADGLIGLAVGDKAASLVEVNSETDFVSRNVDFQNFVNDVSETALAGITSLENLKKAKFKNENKDVVTKLTELVGQIGENIVLRRCEVIEKSADFSFSSYVHGQVSAGLGKIGVILAYKSNNKGKHSIEFAKQIAMHIAASKPVSLNVESLEKNIIEREKKILKEQAKTSGKPDEIIDKMVEGRMSKFYSEIVLLEQLWVIDGESKVSKAIKNFESTHDCNFEIKNFKFFVLGEGIEVEKKDFASEVEEQINK